MSSLAAPDATGQRWLLDRRHGLHHLDRRFPWLLDGATIVLVALFGLPDLIGGGGGPEHHPSGWPAWVGAAALLVPLWWRRRAPVAAFVAVAAMLLVQWSLDIWVSVDSVLLVVLNSLAVLCSMRTIAVAAGWTAAQLVFAVYVLRPTADHRLALLLLLLGTGTAAVAIGLVVRTRRAYLTALEDRAARLETERDQRAQLAAAAERARVAREMHDIVGHHVSVIVGLADGGARLAANREEQAAEPLRLIGDTGRQALGELRRVLDVLRADDHDGDLTPQPGVADLDRLLAGVRAAGLTVSYRTSGEPHRLSPGLQLTVYRIIQEALTNTLKHAGPTATASVTLTVSDDRVSVRVEDRAPIRPAPAAAESQNHGLAGIRERAALYGGTVTAGPSPESTGWIVDVTLSDSGPLHLTEPGTR